MDTTRKQQEFLDPDRDVRHLGPDFQGPVELVHGFDAQGIPRVTMMTPIGKKHVYQPGEQ
jgi:hypothetical protein